MSLPTAACVHCEKAMPIGLTVCPHCGWRQPSRAEQRGEWRRVLLTVLLIIAVVALWRLAVVWHWLA